MPVLRNITIRNREVIHMGIDKQNTIRRALWALGVVGKRVSAYDFGGRALVKVNGEQFGIWDFSRACFVD
jgi:hypothetical protein